MATPKRDKELSRREQRAERKAAFAKKSQGDVGSALWDAYEDIDAMEHTIESLVEGGRELADLNKVLSKDIANLEKENYQLGEDNVDLIGRLEKAGKEYSILVDKFDKLKALYEEAEKDLAALKKESQAMQDSEKPYKPPAPAKKGKK